MINKLRIAACLLLSLVRPQQAYAQHGYLDKTFGNNGMKYRNALLFLLIVLSITGCNKDNEFQEPACSIDNSLIDEIEYEDGSFTKYSYDAAGIVTGSLRNSVPPFSVSYTRLGSQTYIKNFTPYYPLRSYVYLDSAGRLAGALSVNEPDSASISTWSYHYQAGNQLAWMIKETRFRDYNYALGYCDSLCYKWENGNITQSETYRKDSSLNSAWLFSSVQFYEYYQNHSGKQPTSPFELEENSFLHRHNWAFTKNYPSKMTRYYNSNNIEVRNYYATFDAHDRVVREVDSTKQSGNGSFWALVNIKLRYRCR